MADTIETRVTDIINTEKSRAEAAELALDERISAMEDIGAKINESTETSYKDHLATMVDKDGNILAYFDKTGNFHVKGSVFANNI